MITPFVAFVCLGLFNLASIMLCVYTCRQLTKLASYIQAILVAIQAKGLEGDEYNEIMETASTVDSQTIVGVARLARRLVLSTYATVGMVILFGWTLNNVGFSPIIATLTALIQAYVGLLVFKVSESLYTVADLEQKYAALDAQIFDDGDA